MLKKTGTSDMNLLSPGIRAIAYGPGDSSRDHTDREKIKISEYLKSIEIFAETLKLLSKLATPEIEITA
jgi:LysW-gamma-L-lysine carboxypeptidase